MEFNVDPYYDDFEQNAKDNNYVRVLFKPGFAVQARELTQIQSILQNQIKQFGDHIFQDGSPVIGGNLTLDNKASFIKLLETYNNVDIEISDFLGTIVRNSDGTVQAKVLATYFPTDGIPTLMVKYLTGNQFSDGDVIRIINSTTEAQLIASNATGTGTIVSINEGVFYVDGFFVQVNDQSTVVAPYSTDANVKVGLEIDDDIVDDAIDSTLLDPAQSSFNYQAPGADRYQFNLTLSTRPLDSVVDESKFFELMRIENGTITKQVKYPIYAELEKTLARRTFDESGDYTVAPFRATILDGANANNYVIALEPGKAYVKGFEFETLGTVKMEVPKPRGATDIKSLVETDVDISYGNYIYVTSLRGTSNGFINIAAIETVDIHAGYSGCVFTAETGPEANAFIYANTRIGSAKVRNFIRHTADGFNSDTDSNGVYKIYLTDIDIQPKLLKVQSNSGNANTLNVTTLFCSNVNNFINVAVTVLPIRLDAVANVNVANIYANSYRVNANSSVSNAFTSPNVNVGSIIHVGNEVREVVSINTAGDFLTVNTAFNKTFVANNKDSNPLEIYVQSDYTQNVTGQSRIIRTAGNSAGNVFFVLDRPFDNFGIADANTVFQMDFSIKNGRSFIAGPVVNNVLATVANASMNVALNSQFINGDTVVDERIKNTLIFKLPGSYIRRSTIDNSDYNHNKYISNRGNTGTAGVFAISQGDGLTSGVETIPWADSTGAIQDNLILIVRDNNGNTTFPNGSILQLTSANVEIGSPATSLTVNTNIPDILKVDMLVVVKENDADDYIRTKNFIQNTSFSATSSSFTYPTNENGNTTVTLTNYGTVANINVSHGLIFLTDATYNSVSPGDSINLFVPDVVKVRKILKGNTTHLPDANNFTDITENFLIDYGQRDDMYDHAKLILKEGYDVANAKITVHVDFYQHIYNSSNSSFFSLDSYPEAQYNSGSLPIYISKNGVIYNLRDCLDFRPTKQLGSGSGAFQNPYIPSPDEVTELSLDYYLPRIDKLVLSKDKEFRIVQGKSAPQPLPPSDLDDAMTLYTITLPPFVANINEIRLKYRDNRRYTMKDIASIDKRLEKVEFFTSLNNIENLALSDPTEYEDGTKKEKYGIVGENFRNFNIGDYRNEDFSVSLNDGFMLPAITAYPVGLQNITNSSTKINKKTISLNYTETPAITQNVCSDKVVSVQPFLFGQFNGTMSLTPETDYWVNDTLKPEIISVPERVIEHHHVVREIITEPAPPVTIINNYPTTNVVNQIIVTPGTNPPAANANDDVIVTPPTPPPVVPPIPTPPNPPTIVDWPVVPIITCPAPWMRVLLADGSYVPAGELKVGMNVYTMNENSSVWGNYTISHVQIVPNSARVELEFEHVNFVCSPDHKFYVNGEWVEVFKLKVGDVVSTNSEFLDSKNGEIKSIKAHEDGEVVKITVEEAHTYVCEGLLSHNKLPWPDIPPSPPEPPPTPAIPDPPPPVEPPPLDPPIRWNDSDLFELPWTKDPFLPVSFGGFDGSNFYPIVMSPPDVTASLDVNLSYIPPETPITTQPIVLGTNPLSELNFSQPVINPSDVARDDFIGGSGGAGKQDDIDFANQYKYSLK